MTDARPDLDSPDPMRRALLLGSGALAAASALAGTSGFGPAFADTPRPPNILMILADDLGWADVGFHGSDIRTPNLDRLAATGAELDQFYVQPMCTPTRAAFLTGRYPFRYGLQTGVIPSGGLYGLPTDEFILPQVLKQAGYETSLVGKWHVGHGDPAFWPSARGFDLSYGPLIGEIDHFTHRSHGVTDWFRDGVPLEEPGYDTALFGAEAVRQINAQNPDTPFFLYLAFTSPHTPYQAPQAELDAYAHIADPQRRAYAAQITAMDTQIGVVLAALEARGLRDDTLIVFASDNGGTRSKMFAGEAPVPGELPPSNSPLRDGKGTTYEGGTRVVALANWPGRIAPARVAGMMHVTDLLPTFATLAGAPLDRTKPLDGVNAWPLLAGSGPSPRQEIVYNIEPTGGAVRQADLKLVWTATLPSRLELFDLAQDPSETTNLATAHPETVAALQARITGLAAEAQPPKFLMEALRLALTIPPALPGAPAQGPSEDD